MTAFPRVLYFGRSHGGQSPMPGRAVPYYVRIGPTLRPPRKGEWYLSGAIPEAYLASSDLSTPYHIVTRGEPANKHRKRP